MTAPRRRVFSWMRACRRWLVWPLLAVGALAWIDPWRPRVVVRDETEALARVIRSEVGDGSAAERTSVGWAARNRARERGISVARMVCDPWCGPQHEPDATLRPMSSAAAPTPADRRLAAKILAAPASADPTRGADSFIEPVLQDKLVAQGRLGYRRTYAEWRARWLREGQKRLRRVGRFEMWRVARRYSQLALTVASSRESAGSPDRTWRWRARNCRRPRGARPPRGGCAARRPRGAARPRAEAAPAAARPAR